MKKKMLPTSIDSFREIIKEDYYYVDKTMFIYDLVNSGKKVTLFPRPRRFGKSMMLSMLDEYFNMKKEPKNEEEDLFFRT